MGHEQATFGAGCFWGVEEAFRRMDGVLDTEVGYAGGHVDDPSYEQVCTDTTGHAEVVQVTFDPDVVSYDELLEGFWKVHDPTQLNRQGPDVGTQYRSVVFVHSDEQKQQALASKERLEREGRFPRPVVTQIEPAGPFWPAEGYHQEYFAKRGIEPHCTL